MSKRIYFLICCVLALLAAPVMAQAAGLYNVVNYGADPTGAGDSTSQINTAIADALSGGGCVYFPSGTYKVSTLSPVTTGTACFKGDGRYVSTIVTTAASGNVLSITNGSTYQVNDLGFTYSGSGHRTGGAYIYASAGWGLIQNVEMDYAYFGIDSADNVGHYDNVTMETLSQTAASNEIFIRVGAGAGGIVIDGFFNSAFQGTLPLAGVNLWNASVNPSLTITNSDFLTCTNGLLVNPTSGIVAGMMISNTRFDTGINGIAIMLSGTAQMQRSAFVNTWTTSGTGYGVEIVTQSGNSISGLYFNNLEAMGNRNADDVFVDAQAGSISDIQFIGGSMGNAQNGILTINVNNLRIEGVNAGSGGGEPPNSSAGISVNGGSNAIITGNTALGNGSADIWTNASPVVKSNNLCTAGGC